MSTSLSMLFTGLCALVGGGDGKPGDVLLIDARGVGEVRGVTLPEHAPTLVVSLNDLANPESSRPTRVIAGKPNQTGRVDQLGIWDLNGFEIRVRVQGGDQPGLQLFRPSKDETSWPDPPRNANDPSRWRDLRFVPNMEVLVGDGRVSPAFLAEGTSNPHGLPRALAARIHLDAGLLEGGIPSQETYRDTQFEFSAEGSKPTARQAVTDTVKWTLQTESAAVAIDLIPLAGGEKKRLLFGPSATPHRLFVSNLPAENATHSSSHAMTDEDMTSLHFAAYYALLLNQPRLMPLPTPSRSQETQKGTSGVGPVICYPAMFSRQ